MVVQLWPSSVFLITVCVFDPFQPHKTMMKQYRMVSALLQRGLTPSVGQVLSPWHGMCPLHLYLQDLREAEGRMGALSRHFLPTGTVLKILLYKCPSQLQGLGGDGSQTSLSLSRKTHSRGEWKTSIIRLVFLYYMVL